MFPNSSHIQINIYDQNLKGLESRGINLRKVLSNLGCDKHWITEVPSFCANNVPSTSSFVNTPYPTSSHIYQNVNSNNNPPPMMHAFKSISTEINSVKPLNPGMLKNREDLLKNLRKRSSPIRIPEKDHEMNNEAAAVFKRPIPDTPTEFVGNKRAKVEPINFEESNIKSGNEQDSAVEDLLTPEQFNLNLQQFFNDFEQNRQETGAENRTVEEEVGNGEGTMGEKTNDTTGNRIPKDEPIDPDEEGVSNDVTDNNMSLDYFSADILDILMKQGILGDGLGTSDTGNGNGSTEVLKPEEKVMTSSSDPNDAHTIKCQFPGCSHTYSWKVRYGKLRLVDHALTHVDQKLLPCRICGFLVQNVRKMRTHYSKEHSSERPTGYGMKAMPISDQELKELWKLCYGDVIGLIGEASIRGGLPTDKVKRKTRKYDMEPEEQMQLNMTN